LCWLIAVRGGVFLRSGSVLDRLWCCLVCCCFSFGLFFFFFFFPPTFFFFFWRCSFSAFLLFFGFFRFFVFSPPCSSGPACFFALSFLFFSFPLTLGLAVEAGFSLHFLPFWGSGREGVLEMVGKVSPFPQPT
jgi:hypothetical protein